MKKNQIRMRNTFMEFRNFFIFNNDKSAVGAQQQNCKNNFGATKLKIRLKCHKKYKI